MSHGGHGLCLCVGIDADHAEARFCFLCSKLLFEFEMVEKKARLAKLDVSLINCINLFDDVFSAVQLYIHNNITNPYLIVNPSTKIYYSDSRTFLGHKSRL